MHTLICSLGCRRVWLPSFFCPSMMAAARSAGVEVTFYDVDEGLLPVESDWPDRLGGDDFVVFIEYFGFPAPANWIARVRKTGARVLADASQALLSRRGGDADYRICSPRKFLGVPDGGILTALRKRLPELPELAPPPEVWWAKALRAAKARAGFDRAGGDRKWFRLFQEVEAEAPVGAFAMSEMARRSLSAFFDYGSIASRRRENYIRLLADLEPIALFRRLDEHTVPLGFPVRVENRDGVRNRLFEQGIYPPIHWALEDMVPKRFVASHRLSATIMTLPCDQRYDRFDMERIVRAIRTAMADAGVANSTG